MCYLKGKVSGRSMYSVYFFSSLAIGTAPDGSYSIHLKGKQGAGYSSVDQPLSSTCETLGLRSTTEKKRKRKRKKGRLIIDLLMYIQGEQEISFIALSH